MQHQAKVASVAVAMAADQQVLQELQLQELEPLLHQQMAN